MCDYIQCPHYRGIVKETLRAMMEHTIGGKKEKPRETTESQTPNGKVREIRCRKWVYLTTQMVGRKIPSKQRGQEQQGLFKYILTHQISTWSHRCV